MWDRVVKESNVTGKWVPRRGCGVRWKGPTQGIGPRFGVPG